MAIVASCLSSGNCLSSSVLKSSNDMLWRLVGQHGHAVRLANEWDFIVDSDNYVDWQDKLKNILSHADEKTQKIVLMTVAFLNSLERVQIPEFNGSAVMSGTTLLRKAVPEGEIHLPDLLAQVQLNEMGYYRDALFPENDLARKDFLEEEESAIVAIGWHLLDLIFPLVYYNNPEQAVSALRQGSTVVTVPMWFGQVMERGTHIRKLILEENKIIQSGGVGFGLDAERNIATPIGEINFHNDEENCFKVDFQSDGDHTSRFVVLADDVHRLFFTKRPAPEVRAF